MVSNPQNRAALGIAFVIGGLFAISLNDMLIKRLSGGYPLHQLVFIRSLIALILTLVLVHLEGGLAILRMRRPALHLLRCLLIVASNMTFFVALAALSLPEATALFYAAPLFITVLSIPILGEKVGRLRIAAVIVGFAGVIIMQRPWASSHELETSRLVLLLPVLSALTYALNQLLTRKLGVDSKASALGMYVHATFVLISALFFVVVGDGHLVAESASPSSAFLLRAWIWPETKDWLVLLGLGALATAIGYCLGQAYRLANAATVAPFEYIGLPLAVFWGLVIFGDAPAAEVWLGMALILGAGLFVFLRERQKAGAVARGPLNRR